MAATGVVFKKTLKLEKSQNFQYIQNFQKIKIFKKQWKIRGEPPYFRKKIDCFLNIFLFFENFENIENFNFFSSFKVFLKTTPVAHIGNFKI